MNNKTLDKHKRKKPNIKMSGVSIQIFPMKN